MSHFNKAVGKKRLPLNIRSKSDRIPVAITPEVENEQRIKCWRSLKTPIRICNNEKTSDIVRRNDIKDSCACWDDSWDRFNRVYT